MRFIFTVFLFLFTLTGCQHSDPNTLRVGTIAGPETELVKTAQTVALKRYGLHVKVVEFNDYNLPNEALNEGSLDLNIYQHAPYLKAAMASRGYKLVSLGSFFIYPMGIYSNRYASLESLPQEATIALPNDPSNEARALVLLAKASLLTLENTEEPTLASIKDNPKQLRFKSLDAAQLPRVLDDVDAAVINTTFALPAGLDPVHDALFLENKTSPYTNLIVGRQDSSKSTQIQQFIQALHSPEVIVKANELFGQNAIKSW